MKHDTSFTNQTFKVVGTRPPRQDGVDKVTGRARYGADAFAPGQLVGKLLRSPRPFLPPLFLLQATSGATLRAALASFGVVTSEIALGMDGDRDCYVLGGRQPGDDERATRPTIWIDMDSFQVVRVDRRDGVRFRFGPPQVYGGIQAPSWIAIEVPGQPDARLDVEKVAKANAPAAAFGHDWLLSLQTP